MTNGERSTPGKPSGASQLAALVGESALRLEADGVAALSGLFDLTSQRLVRLAVAITRNQHDAEDAVQAALVRVADEPGLLCRAEQPWHYLLRMARNEALQIVRRRRNSFSLGSLADLVTQRFVDQAEQEEEFRAVWLALRKLPVEQSEVVVLKIWEELTFSQIGGVLEISPSTAASRYRYALEKLAVRLRTSVDSSDHHGSRQQASGCQGPSQQGLGVSHD